MDRSNLITYFSTIEYTLYIKLHYKYLKSLRDTIGHTFFGAQHRMTPQFVFQFATLVSVDPAEHLWIVFRRTAVRNAMRPVFGQSVLARRRLQSGRADLHSHRDVRLIVLGVVAPQCSQWLFHAAIPWKYKYIGNHQTR